MELLYLLFIKNTAQISFSLVLVVPGFLCFSLIVKYFNLNPETESHTL